MEEEVRLIEGRRQVLKENDLETDMVNKRYMVEQDP